MESAQGIQVIRQQSALVCPKLRLVANRLFTFPSGQDYNLCNQASGVKTKQQKSGGTGAMV